MEKAQLEQVDPSERLLQELIIDGEVPTAEEAEENPNC